MKIDYDKTADAAYIYLNNTIAQGECTKSIEATRDIILDFDKEDKLIGIEVLHAAKHLVLKARKAIA